MILLQEKLKEVNLPSAIVANLWKPNSVLFRYLLVVLVLPLTPILIKPRKCTLFLAHYSICTDRSTIAEIELCLFSIRLSDADQGGHLQRRLVVDADLPILRVQLVYSHCSRQTK